jgi:hypothetical protein
LLEAVVALFEVVVFLDVCLDCFEKQWEASLKGYGLEAEV